MEAKRAFATMFILDYAQLVYSGGPNWTLIQ